MCEEARCPNIGECWGGADGHTATATIMSECRPHGREVTDCDVVFPLVRCHDRTRLAHHPQSWATRAPAGAGSAPSRRPRPHLRSTRMSPRWAACVASALIDYEILLSERNGAPGTNPSPVRAECGQGGGVVGARLRRPDVGGSGRLTGPGQRAHRGDDSVRCSAA